MKNDPEVPYNELPPLPPPVELESPEILRSLITARVELERVRGAARQLPDQDLLLRAVTLREARLSSEIENIVTTNDALYRDVSLEAETSDRQTKEVRRYAAASWEASAMLRAYQGFEASVFEKIAGTILGKPVQIRDQERVVVRAARTGRIVYTPPVGRRVILDKLFDLARYMNGTDGYDPVVRTALAHYQFEAIHPFTDGNGRTGRILCVHMLERAGVIDMPILYLSEALTGPNRSYFLPAYYDRLRGVTEDGDWKGWVELMVEIVTYAGRATHRRIEAIASVIRTWRERVSGVVPGAARDMVLDRVFSHPVVRIGDLVELGIGNRQTASRYLHALANIGLMEVRADGRDRLFVNVPLLEAMAGEAEL